MKKLFLLLLIVTSTTASADWEKIKRPTETATEKFIDTKTIRQTGPMNTMRRVWELSNLATRSSSKVLSIKALMEYDCKDRRTRVIDEITFSEHGAQGDNLTATGNDGKPGLWTGLSKGSISEIIFNRVCPSDDSDAITN